MRTDIVHIGAGELTYEIRNIVSVGEKLQRLGIRVNWENIGRSHCQGRTYPYVDEEIVARSGHGTDGQGYGELAHPAGNPLSNPGEVPSGPRNTQWPKGGGPRDSGVGLTSHLF